jgi:hypothetical protein
VRATGTPSTVQEAVRLCRPERAFRIRVENGPEGRTRVASGSVVLDGEEVVSSSDLAQHAALVERPVRLRPDSTLAVTLTGTPLGTVRLSIASEESCLEVSLTTPAAGAALEAGPTLVQGTVTGPQEVAVTVNGHPAVVHGGRFAALLPLTPDATALLAVARTADGQEASVRLPVSVLAPADDEPVVLLHPAPAAGGAPLDVLFTVSSLAPAARITLDVEGDGVPDLEGVPPDGARHRFDQPGVYAPLLTLTAPDGAVHLARTVVHVYDPPALDRHLQARWAVFRDALARGDLDAALAAVHSTARAGLEADLRALAAAGAVPQVAADLGAIRLVRAHDGAVEYELRATRDGQEYSFHVLFVLDDDGFWRLRAF